MASAPSVPKGSTPTFVKTDDRLRFLEVLAGTVEKYNWLCHAYCLKDNHYHLVIETPDPNLSLGMRQLNGVYTQAFNRLHQRVGHVFQVRFKALPKRGQVLKNQIPCCK